MIKYKNAKTLILFTKKGKKEKDYGKNIRDYQRKPTDAFV